MRNARAIQAVDSSTFSSHFTRPLYGSYSFARLPGTIHKLLSPEQEGHDCLPVDAVGGEWKPYDLVILFLVDGFGWHFFERFVSKYPFLQHFLQEGIATKITAQFPSTTAAHVTTINTGLEVGQSGVYEWFYYEPLVDRMITPLLYSYAGDHLSNTLASSGIDPEQLFPTQTIYQSLQKRGISSYVFQHEAIAHAPYSKVMFQGATVVPFSFLKSGLEKIVEICQRPPTEPTYIYLYFGDIDAMGHRHGIDSLKFENAVDYCWKMLEEQFWQKRGSFQQNVACLVTADHGMVPIDPKTTLYLNRVFPAIAADFVTNRQGVPLVPAGSCRDFFLHVKQERFESVLADLRSQFGGIAEVFPTQELIAQGFFGLKPPSERFLKRVGNLVILPYHGESIWWYEKHRFEQHFYAAHGGLTPEEMQSIFLFQTSSARG